MGKREDEFAAWAGVVAVIAAVAVSFVASVSVPPASNVLPPTAAPGHSVPTALPSTTLTASASRTALTHNVSWHQTGTGSIWSGHGNWTTNAFFLNQSVGTVIASGETITQGTGTSNVARVLVRQGSTVLANTTLAQFQVSPTVNSTRVNVTTVSVANATGAKLPVATYPVNVSVVSTIDFLRAYNTSWAYLPPLYTASFSDAASNGFWVNSSVLTVPMPRIAVNLSSIQVTVTVGASTSPATYTLNGANIVVYLNPIPSGSTAVAALYLSAVVSPSASPVPTSTLANETYAKGGATTATGTYLDTAIPGYNGVYLVRLPRNATPNLTNLTLSVNGVPLTSKQFTASPTTLTVLPGVVTVYQLQSLRFSATWYAPTGPPSLSLAGYDYPVGGLLLGNVAGVIALVFVVLTVISAFVDRGGVTSYQRSLARASGRTLTTTSDVTIGLLVVSLFLVGYWVFLLVGG